MFNQDTGKATASPCDKAKSPPHSWDRREASHLEQNERSAELEKLQTCSYIIFVKIKFTWNPAKAESNRRKHGVRFEDAVHVFLDPLHLTVQDRIEGGEHRWQTIGQVYGTAVLLVAHTVTEVGPEATETIRIVSARRATPQERKRYANG